MPCNMYIRCCPREVKSLTKCTLLTNNFYSHKRACSIFCLLYNAMCYDLWTFSLNYDFEALMLKLTPLQICLHNYYLLYAVPNYIILGLKNALYYLYLFSNIIDFRRQDIEHHMLRRLRSSFSFRNRWYSLTGWKH